MRKINARIARIKDQRRLGDDWLLGIDGLFFSWVTAPDPLLAISSDSYIQVSLRRSF